MSETETRSNEIAHADVIRRRVAADGEHFMLPRWGIEIIRFVFGSLFRALWDMRVRGAENIPPGGGMIIAANHQTYIDPFWIAEPVRRYLRFLAWDESFSWPVAGRIMRWLGAWPIPLEKGDARAIRRSLQWLREGGAVVIFPEGGRANADGEMKHFKSGAARLALEAGVPILPVTVRGGQQIWPHGWRYPRLTGHLELVYHPLQHVRLLPGETTRAAARRETDQLAETIRTAL
ncbi:MAG: lysophospholipid acyltransferase family protein [Pyrinomonadaceae bacterium]